MNNKILLTAFSLAVGLSISNAATAVSVQATENGLGLTLETPFDPTPSGMPGGVQTLLDQLDLYDHDANQPELPDQTSQGGYSPVLPENANPGISSGASEMFPLEDPTSDSLRQMIENWQAENGLGIPDGVGGADFSEVSISFTTESFGAEMISAPTAVVPVPAAVWLFASGLVGLIGVARRKKTA